MRYPAIPVNTARILTISDMIDYFWPDGNTVPFKTGDKVIVHFGNAMPDNLEKMDPDNPPRVLIPFTNIIAVLDRS